MRKRRITDRTIACFLLFLSCGSVAVAGPAGSTNAAAPQTLEGQVVCSQCWFEADRDSVPYGTEGDHACAAECAQMGVLPALAVRGDDGFRLYLLTAPPPGGGDWLAWTARFVRATGLVGTRDERPVLEVAALEALAKSPWGDARGETRAGEEGTADLHWTDLRGKPTDLHSRAGRVVVINFWATWCRPCIKEMPELVRLHDRFAPYAVEFIAAAADGPEQSATVVGYVRKHGINFPVVLGATTTQMRGVGLPPVLPGTVILDEQGRVAHRYGGVIDPEEVAAALAEMLGLEPQREASGRRQARAGAHAHHHSTRASLVPS